ncbi:MAG TPA: hypothetical protein PK941_14815, partial [Paludibacter sp.]|nr:hypothetical protein [Paludibacter sp.]
RSNSLLRSSNMNDSLRQSYLFFGLPGKVGGGFSNHGTRNTEQPRISELTQHLGAFGAPLCKLTILLFTQTLFLIS